MENKNSTKIFNEVFEKYHKIQSSDEPFSIYYTEPEESERNLCESIIEINESNFNKDKNNYEFGVNYVEDHSSEKFRDSRYIDDSEYLNDSQYLEDFNNSSNSSISIESLLENLIKERENIYNEVKNNKAENNEEELKKEILSSKQKIDKQRVEKLFIE